MPYDPSINEAHFAVGHATGDVERIYFDGTPFSIDLLACDDDRVMVLVNAFDTIVGVSIVQTDEGLGVDIYSGHHNVQNGVTVASCYALESDIAPQDEED